MRTIAADAESIEHRNSQRGDEVSVRRATDLRFAECKIEIRSNRSRFLKQFNHCRCSLQRWTIDPAGNKNFRALVNGLQVGKNAIDLLRLRFRRKPHVDLACSMCRDNVRTGAAMDYADIQRDAGVEKIQRVRSEEHTSELQSRFGIS